MNVDLSGEDMGVLIGKRGQTLDSLQYLASLVANKGEEEYVRVKVDTENYRQRRKDTLENLAKNIASKVRRTGRAVVLGADESLREKSDPLCITGRSLCGDSQRRRRAVP